MNLFRKISGPKSKYDKSIPYAFMAEEFLFEDDEELCRYYFGDTICSLIAHLVKNNISPDVVKLFGLFRGEDILVDLRYCTDEKGNWLLKPELCRSLEKQYSDSKNKIYKGHLEIGECSFEDRPQDII